jgi:hypothetical protein
MSLHRYHDADWELLRRLIKADPRMSPVSQVCGVLSMPSCTPCSGCVRVRVYSNVCVCGVCVCVCVCVCGGGGGGGSLRDRETSTNEASFPRTSTHEPSPSPTSHPPFDTSTLRRVWGVRAQGGPSCNTAQIPNGKFDTNNCGAIASDLTTADYTNSSWRHLTSWAYVDALLLREQTRATPMRRLVHSHL